LVSIDVFEDGKTTPVGFGWFLDELDALGFQLLVGAIQIFAGERDVHKAADERFEGIGGEEDEFRFRTGNAKLNPALFVVEGCIDKHTKTKLLGVEGESLVLIRHGDTGELDGFDHGVFLLKNVFDTSPLRKQGRPWRLQNVPLLAPQAGIYGSIQ
jgi:hypothetical protein